jgi:hypothetical protein
MRFSLLVAALLCGLASASARRDMVLGRTLLQQGPNCARIPNCNTCYNAKNDDAVTVLLCRVCANGYRPTADADQCGESLSVTNSARQQILDSSLYLTHQSMPSQSRPDQPSMMKF